VIQRKGFTLIEMLITLSLLTVLAAVISSLYVTGFRTFKEQMATSIIQSDGQTILDTLTTDIKNGLAIEPQYPSEPAAPLYHSTDSSIIIRVPAVDNNDKIVYSGTSMVFDHIIYYYSNKSIHKIVYADPLSIRFKRNGVDTILDNKILVLGFSYEPSISSASLVTVTISSEIMVGNRSEQIQIIGKARLRNHL
jgi:prepilin-type N-terminal cleavage/methylation domain-containing protein